VFCEPASAAGVAGVAQVRPGGRVVCVLVVVCTLTGNGLKDPDIIVKGGLEDLIQVPAERNAVEKAILANL